MSQTAGARHLWASEQVLRSVNSADGVFVSQHDIRCSSRWGLLPLPPLSAGALIKRLPFVSCCSVEGTPCTDPTLAGPQTFLSNRTSLATAKTHVHWSHAGFISCLVLLFFSLTDHHLDFCSFSFLLVWIFVFFWHLPVAVWSDGFLFAVKDSAKSAGGNHRPASGCRPHRLSEAGEASCQIKSPCNASDLSLRCLCRNAVCVT